MLKERGFSRSVGAAQSHDLFFKYPEAHFMNAQTPIRIDVACTINMYKLLFSFGSTRIAGLFIMNLL
jgi:hypothetical protein